MKGHLEIINLFKSINETDFQRIIQIKTNAKASCLHLAVQHGNTFTVDYILKVFPKETLKILVNEQAEPFGTPLHFAGKE